MNVANLGARKFGCMDRRRLGNVLAGLGTVACTLAGGQVSWAQEPTLDVRLQWQRLRCIQEGDGIGSAEPYMWAVFFKIDGERAFVNNALRLEGTATTVNTLGDHHNLPNHDVDPGEVVRIPAAVGAHRTRLLPIPLRQPIGNTTNTEAAMGCIVVLLEEDNTPSGAVQRGHTALDHAVQDELDKLIPTLGVLKPEPTEEDIKQMKKRIANAVKKAIKDKVTIADWIGGGGNMDDQIGSDVFLFSTRDLAAIGPNGSALSKRWNNEGKWQLEGRISATVVPAIPVRDPRPRRPVRRPRFSPGR